MSPLDRILSTPLKATGRNIQVARDGYAVAAVNAHMNDVEAYAALFAASAEMLAALKESESDLMAYVDRLYKDGPRMAGSLGAARIRLEKVRHAIAKAEGQANDHAI